MTFAHAVVWVDHHRAEVVHLSSFDEHTMHVSSARAPRKLHRKSGIPGSGRAPMDRAFFDEIAGALAGVTSVLIVGPGIAKVQLASHLTERHPAVARTVVGLEALDHPSHGQLVDYARDYFKRMDHLAGVDLK